MIHSVDAVPPPFQVYSPRTPPLGTYPVTVEGSVPKVREDVALVNVIVPADAELRFEGVRTALAGVYRRFVTPPLEPGREYTYDLSATWRAGGREITRHRQIVVRSGGQVDVDFVSSEGGAQLRTTSRLR
jgi:uncharacterized protein (TIGR03000 family)